MTQLERKHEDFIEYISAVLPAASEILDGRLWQGRAGISSKMAAGFDLFVNLGSIPDVWQERYAGVYLRWKIWDGHDMPNERDVRAIARFVVSYVRAGRRVLVRCDAGLNRSGLIVARALIELGRPPDTAIELVRARRSRNALHNQTFVSWLRREVA